ncbi:MAG TPA: hypothetical protein VIA06_08735 [Candidatus Dormibacteraeota bacterium]|jgi:hypothetical protein|nr:hypothetical protein [Candidatus Dormibacteraeota bacterium]
MRDELERLVADAHSLLYPCTIIPTRHAGTYEGGRWAAFRCYPEEVPAQPFGDDVAASAWWHGEDAGWVGLGASPDQAFRALVKRWAERGCRECHGLGMVLVGEGADRARRGCDDCAGWGRDQPVRCHWCGARLRSTGLADHYGRCSKAPPSGSPAGG